MFLMPAVQVTQLLLEPTWRQWAADTAAVAAELPAALEAPMQAAHALLVTFERWLLQLKALRRMVIFGFQSDARSLQQVGDCPFLKSHLTSFQAFGDGLECAAPSTAEQLPQHHFVTVPHCRCQRWARLRRHCCRLCSSLLQHVRGAARGHSATRCRPCWTGPS